MVLDFLDPSTKRLTIPIFLEITKTCSLDIKYNRHVIVLESYYGETKTPGRYQTAKFEVITLYNISKNSLEEYVEVIALDKLEVGDKEPGEGKKGITYCGSSLVEAG